MMIKAIEYKSFFPFCGLTPTSFTPKMQRLCPVQLPAAITSKIPAPKTLMCAYLIPLRLYADTRGRAIRATCARRSVKNKRSWSV